MNAKQIINKVKHIVGINLETAKLADEVTVIEADAFEAGYDVFIIMDEERVPLQPGSYEMENGSILLVETEGMIASVTNGSEAPEAPEAPVEDQDLSNAEDKPKMIVDTKIKETYFNKNMKKSNLEEITPAEADAVIENVEAVEEEILGETAEIIAELTPEAVTEADASEMAVAVVNAVKETIEEMPEEVAMAFMTKKRKYGKKKMSEEEANIVAEAEAEIITAVAEVVNVETPDEVTAEEVEIIAEAVTEAVQDMIADAPEELKSQLLKKTEPKKESKLSKVNKDRVAKAKEKMEKLSKKKTAKKKFSKKPATSKIKHNPHKATVKHEPLKMASKGKPSAMDRVMSKMFN